MNWEKNSLEILNALTWPILVIDRNYHIAAANSAAGRSFCLSVDALIGQECFKVSHKLDIPCWQKETYCPAKVAFELKDKTRVIHQHIHAGKAVFEEIIAAPIFDDQGDVNFIIEEIIDMTELIHSKEIIEHLKKEIKTLRGIIPICSACKRVRDDKGYWHQVEAYVRDRSEAEFSHSICPECLKKLYPDFVGK
ncbi:MAG: PAS domain-containing protein, partial [Deltaproteobacteria bacterium]|nr:PAS domain-containing protein [Deltaproteobacteria bacterium]